MYLWLGDKALALNVCILISFVHEREEREVIWLNADVTYMGTSCWVCWYNAHFAAAAAATTTTAFAWERTRKAFASNPEAKIIYWWSRKVLNLPSFSCSSCLYHLVRCLLCVPLVTWLVIVYISYNAWIDGEHKFPPSRFTYKTSWRWKDGVHYTVISGDGLVWYTALEIA